jgi:hypothetical protein
VWTIGYRLVLVEGGIEQHGHAGQRFKPLEELPVQGISLTVDGLESPCAVSVGDRWDDRPLVGSNRVDLDHEGIGHGPDKIRIEALVLGAQR